MNSNSLNSEMKIRNQSKEHAPPTDRTFKDRLSVLLLSASDVGSISAALWCLVCVPPLRGSSAGSFPEQWLVIELTSDAANQCYISSSPHASVLISEVVVSVGASF